MEADVIDPVPFPIPLACSLEEVTLPAQWEGSSQRCQPYTEESSVRFCFATA